MYLDSYESLLARTEYGTYSVNNEEWLWELFLSSEAIRIIIASRDRLRWDYEDPEWTDYMQQHLLENLSEEDSRWFLEQVPINDEAVMLAKQSISTAEKTGYLSGQAFGLNVLYYAFTESGRIKEAEDTKTHLSQIVNQIRVYKFLLDRVMEYDKMLIL